MHTLNAPSGAVVIIRAAIKQGLHVLDSSHEIRATYIPGLRSVSSINCIYFLSMILLKILPRRGSSARMAPWGQTSRQQ